MKTKILIITTILLLCGQNILHSQEVWRYLGGLSDQYLWKVCAQSPDTVYITGAGASSIFNGQGMIAKSTDGGINWTKTYTATNNLLKDIAFYNKNIGFTIGENGTILKTTDSGINWQLKTSGITQNLNALALDGLNNIWAVGDSGVVVHSVDEGETWQKVDLQITPNLNDIAFKKDTGYIAGNNGLLYKTINAGTIWNKEVISNIILDPSQSCISLSMTENNIYILCGGSTGLGYHLVSKKNSTTWQSNFCSTSSSFAFVNDSVGYSVFMSITTGSGSEVDIYNTNNFGSIWSRVFVDWGNSYYSDPYHSDIYIVSDTVKYVVCGSTILKKTPSITTALKETTINKGLVVFQNPTQQNVLVVKSNLQPIALIELFNVSGNKVSSKKTSTKLNETTVDISHLPVGVYLAKVTFDDKTQTVCKWLKL